VNERDLTIAHTLEAHVPLRTDEAPNWADVLRRGGVAASNGVGRQLRVRPKRPRRTRLRFALALTVVLVMALISVLGVGATQGWWFFKRGATIPFAVFSAVNGRVVGWAPTGHDWFVVYIDRRGRNWCGLQGTSWHIAIVETTKLPVHVVADRRLQGAMCGNALSWVRSGQFSDGRHREVAFMLWASPSLGAQTSVYRIERHRLRLLATFPGDQVDLGRGTVTVRYDNTGRSPHGELRDVYRFSRGKYRLQRPH
jgi:hypothetical protein